MSYADYTPEPREGDDEREALARQRATALRQHRYAMATLHPRDPEHEGAGTARDE